MGQLVVTTWVAKGKVYNEELEMIPMQAWRKQNCIGRAYRYKYVYLSANVSVYVEARGVWGHAPLGRIF